MDKGCDMDEGAYDVSKIRRAGGMADVYKGRDNVLNRYVAVKVLKKNTGKMKHM